LAGVLGILSLGAALFSVNVYHRERKFERVTGLLSAKGDANGRVILLGGTPMSFSSEDGVVLKDGQEPLLRVRLTDAKLYVAAKIRDEKGNLIAELNDNQWFHQVRPGIYDRNYNDQVLEIIGPDGNVVLQVVDLGSAVYVAGFFRCESGWSTVIGPRNDGATLLDLGLRGNRTHTRSRASACTLVEVIWEGVPVPDQSSCRP